MKYVKTYEGLFDKYYQKLPEVKLAMAFVKFLNDINPKLECYYKRNNNGVWVINKDGKILIKIDPDHIASIECVLSYRFGNGWGYDFGKYGRKPQEEWSGEIVNFLDNCFDLYERRSNCSMDNTVTSDEDEELGGVGFQIDVGAGGVQRFIDKLTKENYENFVIESNANKYNL